MTMTAPAKTGAPQWLLQGEAGLCQCVTIGRRRKGSFVAKTLAGASGVLRQAISSEDVAAQKVEAVELRHAQLLRALRCRFGRGQRARKIVAPAMDVREECSQLS